MKLIVLEKARYLINNSWLGLLIPAGVHYLLKNSEKSAEKTSPQFHHHPAESKMFRSVGSKIRP